jgi:uncharacterized protein
LIYLDSCVVIYAVEDAGPLGERVRALLSEREEQGLVISSLVKLECLVGPKKQQDSLLVRRFEQMFAVLGFVGMEDSTFLRAADLRAVHGLKTPDALHLAAALESGCDALCTNDRRFNRVVRDFAFSIL